MKLSNPSSRFKLNIKSGEKVLEVGGGHNPHPRSNVIVDKYGDDNTHRSGDIKTLKNQKFMVADGENLPFKDNEFDYIISNQVLEHVENPTAFLNEFARVAKRGFIETPSLIGEYLFPKESHKWVILEIDNKIVLYEKKDIFPKLNFNFGQLFLTYLQRNSISYKIFERTCPNAFTMRYEWKDSIEHLVNPVEEKYKQYFTQEWTLDMIRTFFPEKSKGKEFKDFMFAFNEIFFGLFRNKMNK
jgi:ubiquinone/menaquinone biosynthesis C-methylase UbiE